MLKKYGKLYRIVVRSDLKVGNIIYYYDNIGRDFTYTYEIVKDFRDKVIGEIISGGHSVGLLRNFYKHESFYAMFDKIMIEIK